MRQTCAKACNVPCGLRIYGEVPKPHARGNGGGGGGASGKQHPMPPQHHSGAAQPIAPQPKLAQHHAPHEPKPQPKPPQHHSDALTGGPPTHGGRHPQKAGPAFAVAAGR